MRDLRSFIHLPRGGMRRLACIVGVVLLGALAIAPGTLAQNMGASDRDTEPDPRDPAAEQNAGSETAEAPSPRWFAVDYLNPGLPPPPRAVSRQTPQATVESFLSLVEQGRFDAAAHLLDLSPIAPRHQERIGQVRARQLARLMERRITIDWADLMDRRDGLDDQSRSDRPRVGEPRRSLLLWRLDLGERQVPIRLNRLKPHDRAPVWVFSRQTVDNLPALAAAAAPPILDDELPDVLRQESPILSLRWWELIALPLLAGTALLLGLAVATAITRLSPGPRRPRLHAIFLSVRFPLTLMVGTVILWAASGPLFAFSAKVDVLLSPMIAAGFAIAILSFLLKTLDRVIDRLQSTRADDLLGADPHMEARRRVATTVSAVRRVAVVLAFFAGVAAVLAAADAYSTFGWSLLASAGAVTLILGFAAQHLLANIMASLQIALNGSAKIGDELLFKGYICHVERINFTFVQLRVWTGERLIVPVTDFVGEIYENWTLQDGSLTRKVEFKLQPSADLPAIRAVYHRVLDEGNWTLGDPDHRGMHVTGQDAFGIDVLFRVPTVDAQQSWLIACDVQEKLVAEIMRLERERGVSWFPDARPADAA